MENLNPQFTIYSTESPDTPKDGSRKLFLFDSPDTSFVSTSTSSSPMSIFSPLHGPHASRNLSQNRIANEKAFRNSPNNRYTPNKKRMSPLKKPTTPQKSTGKSRRRSSLFRDTFVPPILIEHVQTTCFPFASRISELPLATLCSFLSPTELSTGFALVCRSWNHSSRHPSIWRNSFLNSFPTRMGEQSFSSDWKLIATSYSSARSTLFTLFPTNFCYNLDAHISPKPVWNEQFLSISLEGHTILAGIELLPGFFWLVSQTPAGIVRHGIVLQNGKVFKEKGLGAFAQYWNSLQERECDLRTLALLLIVFQALPRNILPEDVLGNESGLETDPLCACWALRKDFFELDERRAVYFNSVPGEQSEEIAPLYIQQQKQQQRSRSENLMAISGFSLVLQQTEQSFAWHVETTTVSSNSRRRSQRMRRSFGRLVL